jgi:calcium/calmodulin-dependent protein kinase I
LFDRLFERGKFTEKDAIKVMGSALRGIEYLYENNVVHRGTMIMTMMAL